MKTKPFNLEKALNGAKVVTRDGRKVTQLTKFECLSLDSLGGVLDNQLRTWTTQGLFIPNYGESDADLFLAVKPKRIWVNVYIFHDTIQTVGNYNTLEAAKKSIDQNLNFIKTIEITDEL
jgi:hypothetical protein